MSFSSLDKFSWVEDAHGILSPKQLLNEAASKIEEWDMAEKTIGLESQMPRFQSEHLRQKFPDANFVEADPVFLEMRVVKTEKEVRRLRKATEITDKAIQAVLDNVYEGITDNEMLQIARRTIIDEGSPGWDHLTLGIGASDPEAPGIGTKMQKGDIVRVDLGAYWKGYLSDVSRHVVLGSPPEGAEEVIDRMIKVQEYCEERMKPGVMPKDILNEAKKYHKTLKKFAKAYITCHSIGLECEEVHMYSPIHSVDFPFEENMVLNIEVWQSFKDIGLIGVEDVYRITKSGCERFSNLDKNILIK